MNGFPDRRYFARIGSESGFQARPLETVFRLARLLGEIERRLSDALLLRGGTALNLLHLDLPRLSVDIDLDFVGAANAEEAQARRPELLAELEALARSAGYEVVPERASYAMAHLRLRYLGADGRPALLKLDVNFLDRVPVLAPVRAALRHPFGDDLAPIEMQTFAVPELAAAKTIALVRRATRLPQKSTLPPWRPKRRETPRRRGQRLLRRKSCSGAWCLAARAPGSTGSASAAGSGMSRARSPGRRGPLHCGRPTRMPSSAIGTRSAERTSLSSSSRTTRARRRLR